MSLSVSVSLYFDRQKGIHHYFLYSLYPNILNLNFVLNIFLVIYQVRGALLSRFKNIKILKRL